MAESLESNAARLGPKAAHALQAVTVQLGNQYFALDILCVREVRGWVAPTPLPHAPAYVKGMIDLRGALTPVVSLADRLGLPMTEVGPASVIVVAATPGGMTGFVADSVSDIISVTTDMIHPPPQIGDSTAPSMIEGILMLEGRIISLISVADIVPSAVLHEQGHAA